jgi:signal transduction histidine kinase
MPIKSSGTKAKILTAIGQGSSFEEIAERIVDICADAMQTEICTLWRVYMEKDERSLRLMAAHGVKAPQTLAQAVTYRVTSGSEKPDGITGLVASTLNPVRVNSFAELMNRYKIDHAGKMDGIQWEGSPEQRFSNLLAVPVHLEDVVVGVLKVENRMSKDFDSEDERRLQSYLEPVAVACKSMLLLDEQEQTHIEAPKRFTEELIRPYDPEQLTIDIVNTTAATLKAELCSLWEVEKDASGQYLVLKASYGVRGNPDATPRYRLPTNPEMVEDGAIEGMTAWVAARRKPFWANSHEELSKHPSWKGSTDELQWGGKRGAEQAFRSLYAVPLLWRDEVLGVLKAENPQDKHHFTTTDHQKCQLLANLVALLLVISRQMRVSLLPEMAHNIKSPVAGIVSNLVGLQEELAQPEVNREYLERYLEYAKRATMTVDVISRTLAEQTLRPLDEKTPLSVDLPDLLQRWIGFTQQMVPRGIQIKLVVLSMPPRLELTLSEKAWIEIIILNLLHNAAKYTPKDSVVTITVDERTDWYCISVEDQGPGIAEEDIPHLFEPGFKRKALDWPEGTGLGLYTVKDRLDRLGWSCWAENREEKGARFIIKVPKEWRRSHDPKA